MKKYIFLFCVLTSNFIFHSYGMDQTSPDKTFSPLFRTVLNAYKKHPTRAHAWLVIGQIIAINHKNSIDSQEALRIFNSVSGAAIIDPQLAYRTLRIRSADTQDFFYAGQLQKHPRQQEQL